MQCTCLVKTLYGINYNNNNNNNGLAQPDKNTYKLILDINGCLANSNSNSKCIYRSHFKYNIILNLIYSKNNRVSRHALRHVVSLSYMPPFVFVHMYSATN